ncbi:hypothetical protein EBZ37_03240 [bacterium]|nr:hypothetical protein [bacterium]
MRRFGRSCSITTISDSKTLALPTKAMLMAAGLGTRLRPFSDIVPKPLTPILGVPSSAFATDALSRMGVRDLVANVHHLPHETKEGLARLAPQVRISDESDLLLGSAGGIKKALPHLQSYGGSSSFFVLNADTICSLELRDLAETHARLRRSRGVTMTLALLSRDAPAAETYREVLVDHSGDFIVGLGEKTSSGKMYVGVAILEPEALDGVPEGAPADFAEMILKPAISSGKVGAHHFSGLWMDVGSPRLWWETHLELMRLSEQSALPKSWLELINRESKQIGPFIWTSKKSPLQRAPAGWIGPSYWDGSGLQPALLGPSAVLYGNAPQDQKLTQGIGAYGCWISV